MKPFYHKFTSVTTALISPRSVFVRTLIFLLIFSLIVWHGGIRETSPLVLYFSAAAMGFILALQIVSVYVMILANEDTSN